MQFEKFKAKAKEALSNFPAFANWAKPKNITKSGGWHACACVWRC